MGVLFGPAAWWQSNLLSRCPEGCLLPDGSIIICKAGGTAWIVAPTCTIVYNQRWGNYATEGNTVQGDLPQITPTIWPTLYNKLVSCGFNPDDWFVPSISQLQNPGRVCCNKWVFSSSNGCYWTSTEVNSSSAYDYVLCNNACRVVFKCNCNNNQVRAFRCVTY